MVEQEDRYNFKFHLILLNCLLTLYQYPVSETAVPSNRTMSSSQSGSRKRAKTGRESDISSKTKKSSAYDPAFEQHLIDHGIRMNNRAQKPSNWAEINCSLSSCLQEYLRLLAGLVTNRLSEIKDLLQAQSRSLNVSRGIDQVAFSPALRQRCNALS